MDRFQFHIAAKVPKTVPVPVPLQEVKRWLFFNVIRYYISAMDVKALHKPLSKREASKLERRARMIAAAERHFLEKGYQATSMSMIASDLGSSKETLWNYFESKEDLFSAFLETATEAFRRDLFDILHTLEPVKRSIEMVCYRFMLKVTDPPTLSLYRLVIGESGRSPEIGQIFHVRVKARTTAIISAFLSTHIKDGDTKSDEAATLLLDLCTGSLFMEALMGTFHPDDRRIRQEAVKISEIFFTIYEAV